MGKKLPPREAELYKRCDEVLHYLWDPIGVAGNPDARDEYYSYLPRAFSILRDDVDARDLAAYLLTTERDTIGIVRDEEHAHEAADILKRWRRWIWAERAEGT